MNILTFVDYTIFLMYVFMLVLVLKRNSKAPQNRALAAFLAALAIWAVMLIVNHNPDTLKSTNELWRNIGSLGWGTFSAFYVWFVIAFIGKEKILKNKLFLPVLFVFPVFFIYQQWTGGLLTESVLTHWGWAYPWPHTLMGYLFIIQYSLYMWGGIYLLANFSRKLKLLTQIKQVRIIYFTMAISLALGTCTDVILPYFGIYSIPNFAGVSSVFLMIGLFYVVVEYGFLTITPAIAAENIISTMTDSLAIINLEGKIFNVNNSLLNLLQYKNDELEKNSISMLSANDKFAELILDSAKKKELIKNQETIFKTSSGENIPVEFSTSIVTDNEGNMVGIVCVARDIRERKSIEEEHKKAEVELRDRANEDSRMNKLMTGRELKMIELKKEVEDLKNKLGGNKV